MTDRKSIPNFPVTFKGMRSGSIIGVINSDLTIESHYVPCGKAAEWMHESTFGHWPRLSHATSWRWTLEQDIQGSYTFPPVQPDDEQFWAIQDHLEKHYGLRFFEENGSNDWKHFNEQLEKEMEND